MIKVEIKTQEHKDEPNEYPCIKKLGLASVVLFTAPRTGILLYSNSNAGRIGRYDNSWVEELFEPFNGSITLTQEL